LGKSSGGHRKACNKRAANTLTAIEAVRPQSPKIKGVYVLISLKRNHTGHWASRQIAERQTDALEAIAVRLANIEIKLEREANPSTHPF
jgi:hypothetical protein